MLIRRTTFVALPIFRNLFIYSQKQQSFTLLTQELNPAKKFFCLSSINFQKTLPEREADIVSEEIDEVATEQKKDEKPISSVRDKDVARNFNKDRSKIIPFETSVRYLKSEAYKETYGDVPVWVPYRRNYKGQFAPRKTRKSCIRYGKISTGSPCPICRDEYLVLDYRNEDLLKQFISPYNGEILGYSKTGVCQKQHFNLLVEIIKAKECGTISFDLPLREYEYEDYKDFYTS